MIAAGLKPEMPPGWRPLAFGLGVDPAPQSGPVDGPEHDGIFRAFGKTRRFPASTFWSDERDGLLFLFELHGFKGLAAYAAGHRTPEGDAFWEEVVASWLEAERVPRLPSWHPYPTSLRLISWAAAMSTITSWAPVTLERMLVELWRHARYLRRSIERDIGGNHVLKNSTALIFAGSVCGAATMLDSALTLLAFQLDKQLLIDGGHEERSTSYHRSVRHDLIEVAQLLQREGRDLPGWLERAIDSTQRWQDAMTGPDGRLPLLNDAWQGPAADGDRSREPVVNLSGSGYIVLRHDRDQAILDVGPISPQHLPAHAHADALSFVLWGDGNPLIIDPGSYAYTGAWRDHFRSTAAHNTVEVDGADQCVLWGDFRAGYHPSVRVDSISYLRDVVIVRASHGGYRRLDQPIWHRRCFIWCPADGLVVVDLLDGDGTHVIRSRLHLAPGVSFDGQRAGPFHVAPLGNATRCTEVSAHYAPYLGVKLSTRAVEDSRILAPAQPFGWSILRPGSRVQHIDETGVIIVRASRPVVQVSLTAW